MSLPGVPEAAETIDLRSGPEIHEALLAVLPLVGAWAGQGEGITPTDRSEFRYAQRVRFAHDGRPFLHYSSRTWLLDDAGGIVRQAFREEGFLRVGAGTDELELVTAAAAAGVSVFRGVAGDQRWEFATQGVGFTDTATRYSGDRRLYALVDGALVYAQELAVEPGEYRPHLQARLTRET